MSCSEHYKPLAVWHHDGHGSVPQNAMSAGFDGGDTIYVGRAEHDGDVIPGKIHPSHGVCYVPHGGNEHGKHNYEVLCNPSCCELDWVSTSGGNIPSGALQGGKTCDGEPLYIGRVYHDGTLTVGKVHPSHECLYIPYGGGEHRYDDYEILVCRSIPLTF